MQIFNKEDHKVIVAPLSCFLGYPVYFNMVLSMVYFWTYAYPSYCPFDLLARGFTATR